MLKLSKKKRLALSALAIGLTSCKTLRPTFEVCVNDVPRFQFVCTKPEGGIRYRTYDETNNWIAISPDDFEMMIDNLINK